MMEEAFAKYLSEDAGVIAAIGEQIDWVIHPQAKDKPYIVLHNITSVPVYSDEGFAGLTYSRIQIDHWARTYAQAKEASRATTARLNSGGSKFTQDGIEFQVSFKVDEQDSFERRNAAEELFRVRLDFDIWYQEEN